MEVELNGAEIASQPSQRPWALLASLALASGTLSRSELAGRFWPDVLDQSARASLRSALWALRRELDEWLIADGDRVGLREGSELWVDVREFDRLAADHECEQALALCRGELLEGLEDEWALLARARHRERVIELMEQLACACEERGEARAAIEWSRRQIGRDPLDEDAARRLIARLGAAGDRAAALLAYRALSGRLRRELAVAPSPQTRELIEQMRSERPTPTAGASAVRTPGTLPLVGREAELGQLEAVWSAAAAGSGAAALIRGEAGIGKTRLASELRNHADSTGALSAACAALDLGGTAPFSLWAELFRELLPALPAPPADSAWPDDLTTLTSELPAHFGRSGAPTPGIPPDLQRTRLFEAAVALLAWAARQHPLLVVFEDVHTADRPSLELLAYAARRIASLPVMLLCTRRELPPSVNADRLENALRARGALACELTLAPLGEFQVAALARSAASLKDTEIDRVVELAEGNALLAVETARALARGLDHVAPSLRGSVRALLAPLAGDARQLIELAAVAARPIEPIELDELAPAASVENVTQAFEAGMLTTTDGRIGFRHALLREAAYAEIAEPRRRSVHLRWAQALLASEHAGGQSHPAEAARHLLLAGHGGDAVEQLARAAAHARAVAALEQAADYLCEAIAIAPERSDLLLELGEIEAWRMRREQAEAAFERAQALLLEQEPREQARALLRRARAYHGPICLPRGVLESCRAALELLDSSDEPAEPERHEALAACAWAEAIAGSIDEAESLLSELGSGASAGDLETYDVGHARALALMRRGRFTDSYTPSIAAGEAVARAGRPDLAYGCWVNAAGAATAAGDPERALEFIDRAMAALAGKGLQTLEVHVLAARAFILTRTGALDDARAVSEHEQRLAEQLAQPELLAIASHDRGRVALETGESELAAELLASALAEDAPISRPLTRLALAEAYIHTGQTERAAAELRATVLEPVRPSDFPDALVPRLARIQGLLALASGDHDGAERRLRESIGGWERLLARSSGGESMTAVLADLGRPVVGLVEPERELARARADLHALMSTSEEGMPDALVP